MIHVEGNMCGAVMRGAVALPGSKATSRTKGSHRNLGDLVWPAVATAIPGRGRKARSRRCLGTGEDSDGPRSTGEAPEQGRDERRRRAWREGGSVGGMADDGRCSGRRTGPSILYPPLACGSATRSNVRARPIALDFRQEPGAGCERKAGMSLPVKVWSVKAEQAGRERVLRASRQRGVRSVDSGWTGCGIDSRNRHVAEAELAPAPAKAAHPVSSCERPDAPPGAWTTSRPKGPFRNL